MPSVDSKDKASRAGIATSATGERRIPASVRADGSVRKEIKVKPGYRPPEDVEVYKNRTAEGYAAAKKFRGVPGAELAEPAKDKPATTKRPVKKKDAADGPGMKNEQQRAALASEAAGVPLDAAAEREKEARRLAKKLRQARDLLGKKEKGDTLLPEQFQKVIKINELLRQLDSLGLDEQGQEKKAL